MTRRTAAGVNVAAHDAAATPNPDDRMTHNIALEDWHLLFSAVKTRLRQVAEQAAVTAESQPRSTLDSVVPCMLECAAALDQLQTTLAHELEPAHPTPTPKDTT